MRSFAQHGDRRRRDMDQPIHRLLVGFSGNGTLNIDSAAA